MVILTHVYHDQAYVDEMGLVICAGCELLYPREDEPEAQGWGGLTPTPVKHRMRCSLCGVRIHPLPPPADDGDADG